MQQISCVGHLFLAYTSEVGRGYILCTILSLYHFSNAQLSQSETECRRCVWVLCLLWCVGMWYCSMYSTWGLIALCMYACMHPSMHKNIHTDRQTTKSTYIHTKYLRPQYLILPASMSILIAETHTSQYELSRCCSFISGGGGGDDGSGVDAYIHAYIHACMHVYMYTCIHTNIRIYIHTYIHTYIHSTDPSFLPASLPSHHHPSCVLSLPHYSPPTVSEKGMAGRSFEGS